MPLSQALRVLMKKGHLKPLESRPLPDPLPPNHNPAKHCAFHQQHSHDTGQCFRLRHEIQDLIDNKGDVQIDWFDLNGSKDNSGWLSDEPDREEETKPKLEEKEARIARVVGMAEEKEKLSESTSIKNLAQELGAVSTADTEQEAALKQFVQERDQDKQEAGKAQHPAGDVSDVRVIRMEPNN
ncbi:hypothetical protein HYC85_029939 [Camellia sinensis]|uniref:Uncharacterized protein n=1 Tax=Camellia sinensis TaxID=4442 RepID=A0A7J7G203_CAMSI|nr:hypothetical protein HYC85_029939 [Camellia sinensis]